MRSLKSPPLHVYKNIQTTCYSFIYNEFNLHACLLRRTGKRQNHRSLTTGCRRNLYQLIIKEASSTTIEPTPRRRFNSRFRTQISEELQKRRFASLTLTRPPPSLNGIGERNKATQEPSGTQKRPKITTSPQLMPPIFIPSLGSSSTSSTLSRT